VLLDEGVEAERIQLIPEEAMALDAALVGAQPGDLLLVFGDNIDRCWKQITEFNSSDAQDGTKSASEATSPAPELPSMPDMSLDLGELIRDERGVRLARSVDLED
jgi:cyanophycin synthetase